MTKTLRKAIDVMTYYSPYNRETGDTETYNEIYDALHKLAQVGIIERDEWMKIIELDGALYKAQ